MDRVDFLLLGQRDDAVDIEVCFHWPLVLADLIGFVGFEPMQAEPVFFGEDGDGAQPELRGRAHDAYGDLTAVQGKKSFHRWRTVNPSASAGCARSACPRSAPD